MKEKIKNVVSSLLPLWIILGLVLGAELISYIPPSKDGNWLLGFIIMMLGLVSYGFWRAYTNTEMELYRIRSKMELGFWTEDDPKKELQKNKVQSETLKNIRKEKTEQSSSPRALLIPLNLSPKKALRKVKASLRIGKK